MNRTLLLSALLLFAGPLLAEMGTITGHVTLQGSSDPGEVSVTVEADRLWGNADEHALAYTEEVRGKYPVATATGSAKTDERGAFSIDVQVSFADNAAAPTMKSWRDGKQVEVPFCSLRVTLSCAGFQRKIERTFVELDSTREAFRSTMFPAVRVVATVVMLNDRSPAPGLPLEIWTTSYSNRSVRNPDTGRIERVQHTETQRWQTTTDANGKLDFSDETMGNGSYFMTVGGSDYAFASASKAANALSFSAGETDLGTLVIVPGGSVTFRLMDADTAEGLVLPCTLRGNQLYRTVFIDENGVGSCTGLPEGQYSLNAQLRGYFPPNTGFKIEAGVALDLGDIAFQPIHKAEIIALSDGGGIERYSVRATPISGTPPAGIEPDKHYIQRELSVERNVMEGFYRGTWRITVAAVNHATASVEAEIPSEGPISIMLEEGGVLSVVLKVDGQQINDFYMYAVQTGSKQYDMLKAKTPEELGQFGPQPNAEGFWASTGRWAREQRLDAMPAGKYFVVVRTGDWGVITRDEIEVMKGEVTALEVSPVPPKLTVNVTREGKPAGGEKVFIAFMLWNAGPTITDYETDENGSLEIELEKQGAVYVLTPREREWVGDVEKSWEWRDTMSRLKGNAIEMRFGFEKEVAIELVDPNAVWVTVKIKVPPGVVLNQPSLQALKADARGAIQQFAARKSGDDWLFARVPVGDYTLMTSTLGPDRNWLRFSEKVTVDTPPEQTIEVEFEVRALSVKLTYPKNANVLGAHVRLIPIANIGDPFARNRVYEVQADASGNAAFMGIEPGTYLLCALAYNQRVMVAGASTRVDASEAGEIELELTADLGSLEIAVEANPALGRSENSRAMFRVQFFNAADEEVLPIDPGAAIGSMNFVHQVQGVPTGTYRLRITGYGILPIEHENVEIKPGVATSISVTPRAAGILKLTLTGITTQAVVAGKATSTYYDAKGNEIDDIEAPGNHIFNLEQSQPNECRASLLNLSPEVTRVVIRIEGFEDIEIDVEVEPGRTILHTTGVKAKTD